MYPSVSGSTLSVHGDRLVTRPAANTAAYVPGVTPAARQQASQGALRARLCAHCHSLQHLQLYCVLCACQCAGSRLRGPQRTRSFPGSAGKLLLYKRMSLHGPSVRCKAVTPWTSGC